MKTPTKSKLAMNALNANAKFERLKNRYTAWLSTDSRKSDADVARVGEQMEQAYDVLLAAQVAYDNAL